MWQAENRECLEYVAQTKKEVEFTEDNDEWWLTTGVPKHGPWF
jgi:hypothetical protein